MSGRVKGLFLILAFLANACASVTPPSGGPRDETPPKLVSSVPENKTLNYSGRIISLVFDEEVELRDLQKELIITPYTENTYTNKVDKEKITLEFEKPLEPNTTYTLNFRKSIRDLTEGNAADFSSLTFSTGSYLDSGSVSGNVVQLLNQRPESETDVLLYRAEDTGTVKTTKPFYVARTDAGGAFQFSNLATGAYRIYALKDLNNTLTYDQDTERIGFIADTIQVTANRPPVLLSTVRIDSRKPFIARRNPQADRAEIEYNEGLKSISLQSLTPGADSLVYMQSTDGKTTSIFRTADQKELRFIATATDSANFESADTVTIVFVKPYKAETAQLNIKGGSNLVLPGQPIVLGATHPVKSIQPRAIQVLDDSTEVSTIPSEKAVLSDKGLKVTIPYPQVPKNLDGFTLKIDSTALSTTTGHIFEPVLLDLKLANSSNTGSVKGRVVTPEKNFILQLLDKNYQVKQSQLNKSDFSFTNLAPGLYKLRLIVDRNGNGGWDNASADIKSLPEAVFLYKEELNIRANWELEDIVFIPGKPVDKPKPAKGKM